VNLVGKKKKISGYFEIAQGIYKKIGFFDFKCHLEPENLAFWNE
jgi:hypothetical protein